MDARRAGLLVNHDLGATYPGCPPPLHCCCCKAHNRHNTVLHAGQCTAHRIMNTKCGAITWLPVQHLG